MCNVKSASCMQNLSPDLFAYYMLVDAQSVPHASSRGLHLFSILLLDSVITLRLCKVDFVD